MANNAKKPNPSGTVTGLAGEAISQHKKMATGDVPKVGGGKKTPA